MPECVNPVYEPEQCCPVCKNGKHNVMRALSILRITPKHPLTRGEETGVRNQSPLAAPVAGSAHPPRPTPAEMPKSTRGTLGGVAGRPPSQSPPPGRALAIPRITAEAPGTFPCRSGHPGGLGTDSSWGSGLRIQLQLRATLTFINYRGKCLPLRNGASSSPPRLLLVLVPWPESSAAGRESSGALPCTRTAATAGFCPKVRPGCWPLGHLFTFCSAAEDRAPWPLSLSLSPKGQAGTHQSSPRSASKARG